MNVDEEDSDVCSVCMDCRVQTANRTRFTDSPLRTNDVWGIFERLSGIPMRLRVETEENTSESGCGVKGHPPDSDSEPEPSDKRTGADRHEPCLSTSDSDLKEVEDGGEDGVDRDSHTKLEEPEKQQLVCTEVQAGPSNWEEFTPEVSAESGLTSYRFRCPHSSAFHCTWTGLVFVVTQEAGLVYRAAQWDEPLLRSAGRTPAGPLFSIKSPENAVCRLHLPHCETNTGQCSKSLLSVVHITEDGMTFIEPVEITDTHVVIDVPHLSLFGLVWKTLKSMYEYIISVSVYVLLVIHPPNPRTRRQKLDVLLLPVNVSLEDVKAYVKEVEDTAVYIKVLSKCNLIRNQIYAVDCPEVCLIEPEVAEFDLNFGPIYYPMFEIHLPANTEEVTLTIRDQENTDVWTHKVDLTGLSTSDSDLKEVEDGGEDGVDRDPHTKPEDPEKQQLVCTEVQAGPSNWEEFTPKVSAESGLTSYRFRCPHSGAFHCTWTGLVFIVTQEAGLVYSTVQWDEPLLWSAGRTPAGPLFSIESPENAVCRLHLPHCETNTGQRFKSLLSVVHITEDGMKFIEPVEITDTHVVIDVPHLCRFGLVWVLERIQKLISVGGQMVEFISQYIRSVSGQVLLFLKPPNPRTRIKKLDVLLLPVNVPVKDVKTYVEEQWPNTLYIDVTSKCDLITNHKYRVECPEASLIQPKDKKFDLNFGPNYHKLFEIRLPTNTEEVTVTIRDQGNSDVWTHKVDLPGPAGTEGNPPRAQQNIPPEVQLTTVQLDFIHPVQSWDNLRRVGDYSE